MKTIMETCYDRTYNQARAYSVPDDTFDDSEAESEVIIEDEFLEERFRVRKDNLPLEGLEYIYTGSIFYRDLIKLGGMMLHSSAVVVDGYAYLFSADSGTGKSTHTGLWLKHFADKAFILNDDKPAIRKIGDEWFAYGTPWSGKTDLNVNTKVKLGAIVFLERSEENFIEEAEIEWAFTKAFAQTTRKLNKVENLDKLLDTLEKLLKEVPIYRFGCNVSDEAVLKSYETIRRI
ncbi:MAG: hypothetical protein E7254_06765 [Lachnospiraceae bacterium]|nr:hypothetical protein [Lachnospiraceae bacterium]